MQGLEENVGVMPSTRHLVCGHLNPIPCTLTRELEAWQPGPQASERQTSQVTSTPWSRALSGSLHTMCLHACDACVCLCSVHVCAHTRVVWPCVRRSGNLHAVRSDGPRGTLQPWGTEERDRLAFPASVLMRETRSARGRFSSLRLCSFLRHPDKGRLNLQTRVPAHMLYAGPLTQMCIYTEITVTLGPAGPGPPQF